MKKLTFICIILMINLTSCHSNEMKVMSHFNASSERFEEFKNLAYKDDALLNNIDRLVKIDKLNVKTRKALEKLKLSEVSYIILGKEKCLQNKEFEIEIIFDGDWHLEYEPCTEKSIEQDDEKEYGFIKSWKIDNGWYIWVNNDIIG